MTCPENWWADLPQGRDDLQALAWDKIFAPGTCLRTLVRSEFSPSTSARWQTMLLMRSLSKMRSVSLNSLSEVRLRFGPQLREWGSAGSPETTDLLSLGVSQNLRSWLSNPSRTSRCLWVTGWKCQWRYQKMAPRSCGKWLWIPEPTASLPQLWSLWALLKILKNFTQWSPEDLSLSL